MADETGTKPGGEGGDAQADTGPMLSRSGMVGPFGSLEDELKTKVDFETAMAFRRLCAEAGTDVSGGLRAFIYTRVHGKSYDALCAEAAEARTRKLLDVHAANGVLIGIGSKGHERATGARA